MEGPGGEEVVEEKHLSSARSSFSEELCEDTWNSRGDTDLREHMEFLRFLRDVFPLFLLHFCWVMALKWGTLVELGEFQRVGMLVSETGIYDMKIFNSNQILHLKAFQLQNYVLISAGELTALAVFLLKVQFQSSC